MFRRRRLREGPPDSIQFVKSVERPAAFVAVEATGIGQSFPAGEPRSAVAPSDERRLSATDRVSRSVPKASCPERPRRRPVRLPRTFAPTVLDSVWSRRPRCDPTFWSGLEGQRAARHRRRALAGWFEPGVPGIQSERKASGLHRDAQRRVAVANGAEGSEHEDLRARARSGADRALHPAGRDRELLFAVEAGANLGRSEQGPLARRGDVAEAHLRGVRELEPLAPVQGLTREHGRAVRCGLPRRST